MEQIFKLIEGSAVWVNGFLMTGVILVLVGIKNITTKDFNQFKLSHHNLRKMDEIVAWSIFYIIFGILIAAASIIAFRSNFR